MKKSKPLFRLKIDCIKCENCNYYIPVSRPFFEQLCPKCKNEIKPQISKFRINIEKKLDEKINIKTDFEEKEYVKFLGIVSAERTPLFVANNKFYHLLELITNLDFFIVKNLNEDLSKLFLSFKNGKKEKCYLLKKNNIIYAIWGNFSEDKGKRILEEIASSLFELVKSKDPNNLKKFERYEINKKLGKDLKSIFKKEIQMQEVIPEQESFSLEIFSAINFNLLLKAGNKQTILECINVIKKIEAKMKEESINVLTIKRKDLLKFFRFPFLEIPSELTKEIGKPVELIRMYLNREKWLLPFLVDFLALKPWVINCFKSRGFIIESDDFQITFKKQL